MGKYYLGIDTSNYKTSVAITDEDRQIVFQRSEFLEVEQGERGLRQSVAFFKHVNVLPSFIEDALSHVSPDEIAAIAVSNAPRRVEGSYMPVFLAGMNAARILAASLQVPVYEYSHQEGHIAAVLHSFPDHPQKMLFFHLSGGTTECLLCHEKGYHIDAEIVGGTKDISIGQLLDRTGVALGYAFPSGKYLDEIAATRAINGYPGKVKIGEDGRFNLSGIETQMIRSVEKEGDRLVPGLFRRVSQLLREESDLLAERYDVPAVYMAGGVSASQTIRHSLTDLAGKRSVPVYFGTPELSGDNAVGISLLGGQEHNETCHRNTGQ